MTILLKKLITEGAWDIDSKASSESRRMKNITSRDSFKKHPFQYFFNPFVRGPLKHLSSETYDGIATIFYKLLKNRKSNNIKSFKELKIELDKINADKNIENNPWEKDLIVLIKGIKHINKAVENIKDDYFLNWLVNPFVKGDLSSKVNYNKLEKLEVALQQYSKTSNLESHQKIEKMREIEHKQTLDKLPSMIKNSK